MTLQRLTNMEQQKIEDEYSDLTQEIERLRSILDNRESRMQIVKDELGVTREKYGDERRSEIVLAASEFSIEDLIREEDMVITISHNGYIKRIPYPPIAHKTGADAGSRECEQKMKIL